MGEIRFCLYEPGKKQSRHHEQLEDAGRRSHAASVAHAARKKKLRRPAAAFRVSAHSRQDEHEWTTWSNSTTNTLPDSLTSLKHSIARSLSTDPLPAHARSMLQDYITHNFPYFLPGLCYSSIAQSVFQSVHDSPLMLHALMAILPFYLILLQGGSALSIATQAQADTAALSHYDEALQLLQHEMAGLEIGKRPDEATIFCTLALSGMPPPLSAAHAFAESLTPSSFPETPLAPPLGARGCQMTNRFNPHVRATYALIQLHGGSSLISNETIACHAEHFDVYFATMECARPILPWRGVPGDLVLALSWTPDDVAMARLQSAGVGFFHPIISGSGPGIRSLRELCVQAAELTIALDHFVRNTPGAPDLPSLVHARNHLQHQLLCFWPTTPLDLDLASSPFEHDKGSTAAGPQPGGFYGLPRAIHLATLIYSDMVLFPLPDQKAMQARLAEQLRATLTACDLVASFSTGTLHRNNSNNAPLDLWLAALGALGSGAALDVETEDTKWWIERLRRLRFHLGVPVDAGFAEVKPILQKFLWWEYVCDPRAEVLCTRVQSDLWGADLRFAIGGSAELPVVEDEFCEEREVLGDAVEMADRVEWTWQGEAAFV